MLIGHIIKLLENINAPKVGAITPQGVTDKPLTGGVFLFTTMKTSAKDRERTRLWRLAHPERIKELDRRYNKNNHEKVLEYHRKYQKNNPEKIKEYAKKHRINNLEKEKIRHKLYAKNNKEKIRINAKKYRDSNPDRQKERSLKYHHGITLVEYKKMFNEQGECCAICGKHQSLFNRKLHVDHDHSNGEIRGLLCYSCNRGLGCFQDSIDNMERAIDYLTITNRLPVTGMVKAG